MTAFQIEGSLLFIYTVYPLLLFAIAFFGIKEARRATGQWSLDDAAALLFVMFFAAVQLFMHWDLVGDFWGPGQQNWKYEYNAALISEFRGGLFQHIHHHGSSFLMLPFFWIFGPHHLSAVYLNSLLFVLLVAFVFMTAREIFASWRAALPAALLVPFFDPLLALWIAGGEYLAAFTLFSAALWLVLRNLRLGDEQSFVVAAFTLQLACMMRVEIIMLWGVWFAGALLSGRHSRKALKYIFLAASFSFVVSSMALGTDITPQRSVNSLRPLQHLNRYMYFLSDAAVAALLFVPGLRLLLKERKSAAIVLLLVLLFFTYLLASSPSSEMFQLSVYLFLPISVIAGGALCYINSRFSLIAASLALALFTASLPEQPCIWKFVEYERESDMQIRGMVDTLPPTMKLMLHPTYSKLVFGNDRSPFAFPITIDDARSKLGETGPFACFRPIHRSEGCWFVEFFRDNRRMTEESMPAFEPLDFGCLILDSRTSGRIEMRIYDCPADGISEKAVAP